jgi:anti-sigma factor RsiW
MNCEEVVEFLIDYVSGSLPHRQRSAFEQHLRECAECLAYLASYRQTVALGKQAFAGGDEAVPDDMPERLIVAIRSARAKP